VRRRVPFTGGERESLHVSLDRHRDVVLWKVAGLPDERLRRPMTPSGIRVMRWVLIHMLEETARHTGHMDIIRELIDGATGDHPPD
jgi:hypothetical protein